MSDKLCGRLTDIRPITYERNTEYHSVPVEMRTLPDDVQLRHELYTLRKEFESYKADVRLFLDLDFQDWSPVHQRFWEQLRERSK